MRQRDELVIQGGAPMLIPPGDYDGIVTRFQQVWKFHRLMHRMTFRIISMGPYHDKQLDAYLPVWEGEKR